MTSRREAADPDSARPPGRAPGSAPANATPDPLDAAPDAAPPGSPAARVNRLWLLGALALSIIAAGVMFLDRSPKPGRIGFPTTGLPDEPDVYIEGATLRQFDPQGTIQYRLTSDEIRYFERDGLAQMVAPNLIFYDKERHAWRVQAAEGTIHARNTTGNQEEFVELRDDVVLQQADRTDRLRLTTSALTLFPDRQYARTDQAVIIDSEVGRTAAAGLEGDLEGGVLKLYSSAERPVQTILLPEHFK